MLLWYRSPTVGKEHHQHNTEHSNTLRLLLSSEDYVRIYFFERADLMGMDLSSLPTSCCILQFALAPCKRVSSIVFLHTRPLHHTNVVQTQRDWISGTYTYNIAVQWCSTNYTHKSVSPHTHIILRHAACTFCYKTKMGPVLCWRRPTVCY